MEIWKDIRGWEGRYQVSDQGRVRSCDRLVPARNRWGAAKPRRMKGKVLAANVGGHGYRTVTLSEPGRQVCLNVHALVAMAFLGPPPSGQEVRHRNGIRSDCRLANLHHGTRSENALDRRLHGTARPLLGERCPSAKLTARKVCRIRAAAGRISNRALARKFGVHHKTIAAVVRRTSWKEVQDAR